MQHARHWLTARLLRSLKPDVRQMALVQTVGGRLIKTREVGIGKAKGLALPRRPLPKHPRGPPPGVRRPLGR